MSLLEDIFDLLQNVLEYFGVSPDMLIPVWESQLCGQYRSLVRMIGTNLPLTPSPRIHFQIPLHTSRQHRYLDVTMDTLPAIPSLADVLWVAEDEGERFTKIRHRERPSRQGAVSRGDEVVLAPPRPGDPGLAAVRAQPGDMMLGHRSDPVALRKITALEDELLKLRAQIAMIVTAPPSAHSQNLPGTPGMSPASVLTSTPCRPPPPPCPPPPPPCPPPPSSSVGLSAVENLIQQGREAGKGHAQGKSHEAGQVGLLQSQDKAVGQGPVPTMLDVLNELNQVARGTPVRRRRSKGAALLSDPASMIAEALRRKFAHRRLDDSYDKENRSVELSPFGSPDTSPCIPQQSKRSQGRLHL